MYVVSPLVWEVEGWGEGIIPISFQNERRKGEIIFRGKYVNDNVLLAKDLISTGLKIAYCDSICAKNPVCVAECTASFIEDESKRKYHHCGVMDVNGEEIYRLESLSEGECNNTKIWTKTDGSGNYIGCLAYREINADDKEECKNNNGEWMEESGESVCIRKYEIGDITNEEICKSLKTEAFYKVFGKYERTNYDNITIYIVGEEAKNYTNLTCGEGEQDVVTCKEFSPDYDKVELIWTNNELDLKPNEKKFVYSGVKVSLKGWPGDLLNYPLDLNFGIKADATYRVEMERSDNLQIKNLHYTD
jgi:hypothetical protein